MKMVGWHDSEQNLHWLITLALVAYCWASCLFSESKNILKQLSTADGSPPH